MPNDSPRPGANTGGLNLPPADGAGVDLRARAELRGWRLLACAVLLNAGVSAVLAAGFSRQPADAPPRVASVRLAELVAGRVDSAARENPDAVSAARSARDWARALESALDGVSIRSGVVLLPAQSVAAGAPDLTAEVETELARILAAGEVPP